ncbi:hypothetical protein [Pseudomonas japonica]|uniref:hypothetical protein n=1 Tax=Pseudomonas japonica TaxID=256466 RepID=UPI0015E36429|nr:hypothetical protein [Pseudomonas japonica]MBA1287789.1 hypothetical protein [Pseudomonas japonica]
MPPRYLAALLCMACVLTAPAKADDALQVVPISPGYALAAFANQSVTAAEQAPEVEQAVIILHGVRRNPQDYFHIGQQILAAEHWTDAQTLLLAPGFFTARDNPNAADVPLWDRRWMQGSPSVQGQAGITPLQALDDLLAWLGNGERYPRLKRILLIGHSAGGQLLQRYAVFGNAEQRLSSREVEVHYVISSPSSYLYFDDRRPSGAGFDEAAVAHCPEVNHYRYGLEGVPGYLAAQPIAAHALFERYAKQHITYLVGAADNDPGHRLLDKTCAAEAQGSSRLDRQRHFLAYERLLGQQWHASVAHAQAEVPGVGHNAEGLYASPVTLKLLANGSSH